MAPQLHGTAGVVFVVDAGSVDAVLAGKELLSRAVLGDDDLRGLPILVLANHQDAPGALGPPEVAAALGVVDVRGREVHVQGAVATTGVGLQEGLAWLLGAATRTGS